MSETLQQFIVRRRGELDAEASRLNLELSVVETERGNVDKVAMMLGEGTPTLPHKYEMVSHVPLPARANRRVSEATIKELVLDILDHEESDLTALAILDRINARTGIDYPRTSLSPQLSRLKAEGKIHREGRHWMLGGGPDVGIDIDQAEVVDEDPQADYKIDEAPTKGAETS